LNLDKVIKHNVVKYVKYKKEEYINLKMRIKTITFEKKQINLVASKRYVQTFLYVAISKRKQNNNAKNLKEHRSKIVRAIMVFIAQDVTSKLIISKHNFAIINKKDNIANKLVILVSKI